MRIVGFFENGTKVFENRCSVAVLVCGGRLCGGWLCGVCVFVSLVKLQTCSKCLLFSQFVLGVFYSCLFGF